MGFPMKMLDGVVGRLGEQGERDENDLRSGIIDQLEQSLTMSQGMMTNLKLDPKTRERWTQLHTNTAQVLNQVLRDKQYRDWEKRLKELKPPGESRERPPGPGRRRTKTTVEA